MDIKMTASKSLAIGLLMATAASVTAQDITTVADFENGTQNNNISGFWYFVDDAGNGGDSRILSGDTASKPAAWSSESVGPGNAGSTYAAKLAFAFGTKQLSCGVGCTYAPEVIIGTDIRPAGDSAIDLTGATKLTFFAKAEPSLSVTIVYVSNDITDYSYFRRTVLITSAWKEYTVLMNPASNLSSPGWGQSMGKTPNWAQASAVNFSVSQSVNSSVPSGTLYLDDVKLHNWKTSNGVIGNAGRAKGSHAIHQLLAGGPIHFTIPAAYRKASGKVAVMDLSGRILAHSRFAAGQEGLDMAMPRTTQSVFLRVLPD